MYPGLRYAHKKIKLAILENVCLLTKLDLRLKKMNTFWGNLKINWKFFCVAIKKMPVIQTPYMRIV